MDDAALDDWLASLNVTDAAALPAPAVESPPPEPPSETASDASAPATLLDALADVEAPADDVLSAERPEEIAANANDRARQRYLLFTAAGSAYGVLESAVIEVGRVPQTTAVPHTPNWVRGVTSLRGDVLSVVDFRALLGLESTPSHTGRLLVARLADEEVTVGFLVDGVEQIANIARGEVRPPDSPLAGALAEYLVGTCRVGERFVAVLDLDRLLRSPELRQFDDQGESSCEARI